MEIATGNDDNKKKSTDPRVILGKILADLKKNGNVMVHSLCVDVKTPLIIENNFVLVVSGEITLNSLKKQENLNVLVESLRKLGYNYNVTVRLEQQKEDLDKIAKLTAILGYEVKLKK